MAQIMKKRARIPIMIIGVLFLLMGCSSNENAAGLGSCLTENGVKMFGAYWCPHCQAQKELLGNEWKDVNYIECSLPNREGQTQECKDLDIMSYPTWEFNDGSRIEGEMSLADLRAKSGCAIEAK